MDKDLTNVPEVVLLKNAISGIPLKYGDHVVGTADMMPNGSIHAHIEWAEIPKELHRFFSHGLAESLSIGPNLKPAVPEEIPLFRSINAIRKAAGMADVNIPPSNVQPGLYISRAIELVYQYVKDHLEKTDTHVTFGIDDVFVVWFGKTLQNWKALVSTTLPDGMYYEVTYDGDKKRTYIDAYKKFDNVTVHDEDTPKLKPYRLGLENVEIPAGDDRFA